jgi:hypothetical protein
MFAENLLDFASNIRYYLASPIQEIGGVVTSDNMSVSARKILAPDDWRVMQPHTVQKKSVSAYRKDALQAPHVQNFNRRCRSATNEFI